VLTVLSTGAVNPISVTVNPAGLTILPAYPGSNRSFKLQASGGNPPYTYQWTPNGQPLPVSTTIGASAGGCDLVSLDCTEQSTRVFLNGFADNCGVRNGTSRNATDP